MITLTLYEFKKSIKYYLSVLIITIVTFLILLLIDKFGAESIYNYINHTPTLFYLLGFENTTLTHTSITLIMIFLLIISPLIYFSFFWKTANSFWEDYYCGSAQFFYSMPISRMEYWFSKALVHIGYLFVYFILLWGICLTTALSDAKTQLARTIAVNQTNRFLLGILTTSLLFFTIGLFLGSVKNYINKYTILKICPILVLLTMLPNIINCIVHFTLASIDSEINTVEAITMLAPLTGFLKKINPIYYGNPCVTRFYGMNVIASATIIIISLLLTASAIIIYSKKNLFTD